jgi:hypothetical protein
LKLNSSKQPVALQGPVGRLGSVEGLRCRLGCLDPSAFYTNPPSSGDSGPLPSTNDGGVRELSAEAKASGLVFRCCGPFRVAIRCRRKARRRWRYRAYAAHIAALAWRPDHKVKLPTNFLEAGRRKKVYEKEMLRHRLAERAHRPCGAELFKRPPHRVFSGGEPQKGEKASSTLRAAIRTVGHGIGIIAAIVSSVRARTMRLKPCATPDQRSIRARVRRSPVPHRTACRRGCRVFLRLPRPAVNNARRCSATCDPYGGARVCC